MVRLLPVGQSTLLGNFGNWPTPCYFRILGPGNARFAPTAAELDSLPVGPGAPLDGMPQAQADGEKERFWAGELRGISDAAGTYVIIIAPQFEFSQLRGIQAPPDLGGNTL